MMLVVAGVLVDVADFLGVVARDLSSSPGGQAPTMESHRGGTGFVQGDALVKSCSQHFFFEG